MVDFKSNVCRVCLSGEKELVNICSEFIVDDKQFYLETVLEEIGGIKINANSELPLLICSSCLDEAIAANTFREKCQTSEQILQQYLKQAQGIVDGIEAVPVTKEVEFVCVDLKVKKVKETQRTGFVLRPAHARVKKLVGQMLIHTKLPLSEDVLITSINKYISAIQPNEHCYESFLSRYKCNMCYDVFSDEAELISHLRIKHTIAQYQCKLCSELFETSVGARIHMTVHNQAALIKQEMDVGYKIVENELVCTICDKAYKDKKFIMNHLYQHRTGRIHSSYVCDYCGKSFPNRCKLEIHIRGMHLNLRPYSCTTCGKRLKSKRDLHQHYVTHTKIKSFSCSICGIGLVNKASLILHERIHNDDRPYQCDICGRGFVSMGRCNVHRITAHTKPTKQCPRCPALFHKNCMVNTHIKKVHLKTDRRRKPNRTTRQHTGHT